MLPLAFAFALCFALAFAAAPAEASVPADTVVLTRAGTVEQRALPSLLALPGTTVSALELHEAFALGVWFDSDDVLAYTVGGGPPRRIDPTAFVPPTPRARYYDPALGGTRPATVVAAAAAGGQASFDLSTDVLDLTELLAPDGAVLVFATPVPEPAVALGLSGGVGCLLAFDRLRRRQRGRSGTRAGLTAVRWD